MRLPVLALVLVVVGNLSVAVGSTVPGVCPLRVIEGGIGAEATVANAGMEYVPICRGNGECLRVSRLVMGTDHLGQEGWTHPGQPPVPRNEMYRVLDEAARLGINMIDSSPIYVGDAENTAGAWRRLRNEAAKSDGFYAHRLLNPDRKLYFLTKGGFPFDLSWSRTLEPGPYSLPLLDDLQRRGILAAGITQGWLESHPAPLANVPPGTYASRLFCCAPEITRRIAEELAHSIANLGDDITFYLMHRDDGDAVGFEAVARTLTPVREILLGMGAPEVANKLWMFGVSNWETERVNEAVRLASADPSLPLPAINSPYFSLFEMNPARSIHALGVQVTHEEMMNPGFQPGIKLMPYSPLGGFSILDQPEPSWETAKREAKAKYEARDPYWQNVYPAIFTPENEARWHRVVDFTRRYNRRHGTRYTVDQMVNAYALAHPRTDFLAIGAITVEQVQRTVASLRLSKTLVPADLDYLHSGRVPDSLGPDPG